MNFIQQPIPPSFNDYMIPHKEYNDQDQYPSCEVFETIIQDYLHNLSLKKRDKALIDQDRYDMILQVLKDPRNTAISTAQFRFWVKKMFQLSPRQAVCHDGKPVAMREQIYGILVRAHREAHHGGRDKTSALVRKRYSWIPKELIARFVRHCPFCISRRNGSQYNSLGIFLPVSPPTYAMSKQNSVDRSSTQPSDEMVLMAEQEHYFNPNDFTYMPDILFNHYPMFEQKPMTIIHPTLELYDPLMDNLEFLMGGYKMTSPSLSLSASSCSSSPVHPAYHETSVIQCTANQRQYALNHFLFSQQ
ncbi:uncharacterized protein B0P05DRAFT_592545 [Gilbertella persicaria]|uniref:uncharacterized protein n=1 Tax=Gilbertella persicaria TaxID=101096 RepID=UPI00221F8132|nr:uncharacterized protein B0P05DRAFT_592545 [Gilbertella persicaria]KAI8047670.1 hypothetical protein B0P05DRAFT_592545 [Gilbertella persicaria]